MKTISSPTPLHRRLAAAAAALLLAATPALQTTPRLLAATVDYSTITWTGTADSNWFNPDNWTGGSTPIPGSTDYVRFGQNSRTDISISNTGTTDLTATVGGLTMTAYTAPYVITLSGNEDGWMNLNISGGGFYSVNNSNNDKPVSLVLESYSRLLYTGINTAVPNSKGRATLWGANITMHGNSELDISQSQTGVNIGTLTTDPGTLVTLGTNALTLNGRSTINGTVTSDKTTGEALRFWGPTDGTYSEIGATGHVILSGSSYVYVRSQNLVINGIVDGDVRTESKDTPLVSGTGTINGDVYINNTASIRGGYGDTRGTLTVNGDVTIATGGALSATIASETNYDQIAINGNLDLSAEGDILSVGPASADFIVRDNSYKIATITGDVIGDFSTLDASGFGVTSLVDYRFVDDGSDTELWIDLSRKSFASVAGITPNQIAIAQTLDDLVNILPDTLIRSLDSQLTVTSYGKVLNQLGPQAYQSWFPAAVVQTNALGFTIEQRLALPDAEWRARKKFDIYVQLSRYESTNPASADNEYYEFNPEQLFVGADYAFSPKLLGGVFFASDKTDYTLDDSGSSGDSDSFTFGVYGRARRGNFQLTAIGFYGTDDYTARRSVELTGLGTYADASTDGERYGGRLMLTYTLQTPWLDIVPVLGVQYVRWKADAFQEYGDAGQAALAVGAQKEESFQTTLGVQFSRSFKILAGKAQIRPFLNVQWIFEACRGRRELDAMLMGAPVSVEAAAGETQGLHVEGGVSVDYANGLSLFASYGMDNNVIVDQTAAIRAGIGLRF